MKADHKEEEKKQTKDAGGQTWQSDVFVPTVQNIIGGASTGLLIWLGHYWWTSQQPPKETELSALLIGAMIAALVTIVRFFGDDLGIVNGAFWLGVRSQKPRIEALQIELAEARELAQRLGKSGSPVAPTKELRRVEDVTKSASYLIRWHFEGLDIDRRSCESRNMPQKAWRDGRKMLIAAGVHNGQEIIISSIALARQKLEEHYRRLVEAGGQLESYVAPV